MRNEKILVVEFEENSLNSLLEILQTEGFQVVTAKDGHEGLLMFESENPDLVILEPMLLKLHGFDLCRKISKDSNKKIPVIITTGFYKGEHYKSEAMETFGASAFFEKPYENEALMMTIHELLGNGTSASVKETKKEVREEKTAAIDIDKSVEDMERSIREQETAQTEQDQKSADPSKKAGKTAITTEVDEMLQDALSDFGLSIDKKPEGIKAEKKQRIEEVKEKESPVIEQKAPEIEKEREAEDVKQVEELEEEKELKTEELIEELIQKEEQIEEEERPEEKHEEKPEEKVIAREQEEKVEVKEEEPEQEIEGKGTEADQKIFEDYFEEPEKAPVHRNLFGFLKKFKQSLPLMIGSTAFVVLVAAGATYYFLKPNKPKTVTSQKSMQPVSNVERSSAAMDPQELTSAPETQGEPNTSDPSGGPTLEGAEGNLGETATPVDDAEQTEMEQESTSEFMSTTGLSSRQREVMLPDSAPSPESRQFEIIEVEEASEEQLGEQSVEISSPQLEQAAKNIIQSENTSDRIKTGDLVPIESVDVPPVATKKINPKYPPAAFQRGIEETVVFRALISEFGNVLDVAFVDPAKTAPAFKKSCEQAVRQWRFSPAKKDGVNVKVWKMFSITFKKNKTE